MTDFSRLYSEVTKRAKASAIRELLKVIANPDVISFAGGLPDPHAFPSKDINAALERVLEKYPFSALQYGATEGSARLKTELIKWLKEEEKIDVTSENLIITSASQQGLDMAARLFIDPGDSIVVTNPTYLGALQAFQACAAHMVGADSDENGVIPESLEKCLREIKAAGKICKFVYLVPDFLNPTGLTIPQDRRKKILEIVKKYDTFILEDSPYRAVRFEGTAPDTFYRLDGGQGNVVTLFTFSKVFVPGFRLGYIAGPAEVIRKFVVLKQALDLCSPKILQLATMEYLRGGHLAKHIKTVVSIYKVKRDLMLAALKKYMPAGVKWTHPDGGLFLWLEAPKNIDADEMLAAAIKNKVAYVAGSAFYHDGSVKNTMRLNFSYATHAEIDEGIKRLAATIKNYGK